MARVECHRPTSVAELICPLRPQPEKRLVISISTHGIADVESRHASDICANRSHAHYRINTGKHAVRTPHSLRSAGAGYTVHIGGE